MPGDGEPVMLLMAMVAQLGPLKSVDWDLVAAQLKKVDKPDGEVTMSGHAARMRFNRLSTKYRSYWVDCLEKVEASGKKPAWPAQRYKNKKPPSKEDQGLNRLGVEDMEFVHSSEDSASSSSLRKRKQADVNVVDMAVCKSRRIDDTDTPISSRKPSAINPSTDCSQTLCNGRSFSAPSTVQPRHQMAESSSHNSKPAPKSCASASTKIGQRNPQPMMTIPHTGANLGMSGINIGLQNKVSRRMFVGMSCTGSMDSTISMGVVNLPPGTIDPLALTIPGNMTTDMSGLDFNFGATRTDFVSLNNMTNPSSASMTPLHTPNGGGLLLTPQSVMTEDFDSTYTMERPSGHGWGGFGEATNFKMGHRGSNLDISGFDFSADFPLFTPTADSHCGASTSLGLGC